MVKVYLVIGKENQTKSWQHETGHKLLSYVKNLEKNSSLIYSNISHSRNIVAVALSDSPVGVDVECIRQVPDVGRKLLSEREKEWVLKNKQTGWILPLWTLKESYGKAYGVGISYPMQKTEFFPEEYISPWTRYSCSDKYVTCFNTVNDTYTLSVCVRTQNSSGPILENFANNVDFV